MNYSEMSPSDVLVAASLATAEQSPVTSRIAIYRAVAATTADKELAKHLRAEADAFEQSHHRSHQLVLSFRARAESTGRA